MTKLICDVNTCVFHQQKYCTRSHIKVSGVTAKKVEETSCDSFHKKERVNQDHIYSVEFAELGTLNRSLSINCDAKNCRYNRNELCYADEVNIGNTRAKVSKETKCETFQERES